jgi:hypothetical protein
VIWRDRIEWAAKKRIRKPAELENFRERTGIADPLTDIDGMAVFWQRT